MNASIYTLGPRSLLEPHGDPDVAGHRQLEGADLDASLHGYLAGERALDEVTDLGEPGGDQHPPLAEERLRDALGFAAMTTPPDESFARVKEEIAKWAKVIREANIQRQ